MTQEIRVQMFVGIRYFSQGCVRERSTYFGIEVEKESTFVNPRSQKFRAIWLKIKEGSC